MVRPQTLFVAAYAALLFCGCARWSQLTTQVEDPLDDTDSFLPAMQVAGDSVTLEVAHLLVSEPFQESFAESWREIDESIIDPQTRQSLHENGIRLGRIGGALPEGLQELVSQPRDQLKTDDGLNTHELIRIHRIQMATDHEKEVAVGSERDELAVLRLEDGDVRGGTLKDAQCRFTLRAESEVNGARLHFKPWIIHGPVRQSFSGEGGAWRISPEREREEFPKLGFSVPLGPGETLVVAPTEKWRGVGKMFFGETPAVPRIMLIRLASSKSNALFDSGDADLAPISSLGE